MMFKPESVRVRKKRLTPKARMPGLTTRFMEESNDY